MGLFRRKNRHGAGDGRVVGEVRAEVSKSNRTEKQNSLPSVVGLTSSGEPLKSGTKKWPFPLPSSRKKRDSAPERLAYRMSRLRDEDGKPVARPESSGPLTMERSQITPLPPMSVLAAHYTAETVASERSYSPGSQDYSSGYSVNEQQEVYEIMLGDNLDEDTLRAAATNSLSPQRKEFLSRNSSPVKPYRRYDDGSVEPETRSVSSNVATNESQTESKTKEFLPTLDWKTFVTMVTAPALESVNQFLFGDGKDAETVSFKEDASQSQASKYTNGSKSLDNSEHGSVLPFDEREEEDPTFMDEYRIMSRSPPSILKKKKKVIFAPDTKGPANHLIAALQCQPVGSCEDELFADDDASDEAHNTADELLDDEEVFNRYEDGNGNGNAHDDEESTIVGELYAVGQRVGSIPVEEEYDELFTIRFLQEITQSGIPIVYYKSDGDRDDDEWAPSMAKLSIAPGKSNSSKLLQPQLIWTTIVSPKKGQRPIEGDSSVSVSLLGIHSIHTSKTAVSEAQKRDDDDGTGENVVMEEEESVTFFTITTEQGEVHVFEALTISERDRIVNGLKNVVARLSLHLISGNMTSSKDLVENEYDEFGDESGELPSLKTSTQAMNDVTHAFLD